jgi:hypothetical protein
VLPTKDTLVAVVRDSGANHEKRYLSLIVLGCSGDQLMAPVMIEALRDPSPGASPDQIVKREDSCEVFGELYDRSEPIVKEKLQEFMSGTYEDHDVSPIAEKILFTAEQCVR